MSAIDAPGRLRPEFNFTELSTIRLLTGVGVTCAMLWSVIAIAIGG